MPRFVGGQTTGTNRFGIRAKLYSAFALLAAMTVIVALVALRAFNFSSEALMQVADVRVPALVALSDLVQRSNGLSVAAPSVVLSTTDRQLVAQAEKLEQAEGQFVFALDRLYQLQGESERFQEVSLIAGRVSAHLQLLISAKHHSMQARSHYRNHLATLDVLFSDVSLLLEAEEITASGARAYLSSGSRVMSHLVEVGRLQDVASVQVMRQQVEQLIAGMRTSLQTGKLQAIAGRLRPVVDELDRTALGEEGMLRLRLDEILSDRVARDRLVDIQDNVDELNALVSAWLWSSRELIIDEQTHTEERLSNGELLLLAFSLTSILVAGIVGWFYVGRHILGRIDGLNQSMRAIAGGDLDAPLPQKGQDEVSEMASALSVFREAMKQVRHLAAHDRVTGLGNRMMLENEINRRLTLGEKGAILYVNLSAFREINDSFGLDFGDRVLRKVGRRLRRLEGGIIAVSRLRSDHFGALIPNQVAEGSLRGVGEEVRARLSRPMSVKRLDVEVCPSIGIVRFPQDGTDPDILLRKADMAMNAAPGDVGYRLYEPEVGEQADYRKTIRRDLKTAMDEGQIDIAFQPKLNLHFDRITSVEALVRWHHPTMGWINPGDFIPIAERSGQILELGEYVLRRACQAAYGWMQREGLQLKVAVNVSPLQLSQPDFVDRVRTVLSNAGLAGQWLELEVTESVFVGHGSDMVERLEELRRLGVGIAIDDFGTGYSSLSYLERLPVTCLKIDRAFVNKTSGAKPDTRTCRAILSMAQDFGLEVVAEGVETADQLDYLRAEACDHIQGFLISKALFRDDLVDFIHHYHAKRPPRLEVGE